MLHCPGINIYQNNQKYVKLSDVLADTNVIQAVRASNSQTSLSQLLASIALALDRHMICPQLDTIADKLNSLAIEISSNDKAINELSNSLAARVADLLDKIDSMVSRFSQMGENSRAQVTSAVEEDMFALKRAFNEEAAREENRVGAGLVAHADRLQVLASTLEKEIIDCDKCQHRLLGELGDKIDQIKRQVEGERQVRIETTSRIRDIIQEANDDLDAKFHEEVNMQKMTKDSLKKLIHQIKNRLYDMDDC